jgi:hypothetical protein
LLRGRSLGGGRGHRRLLSLRDHRSPRGAEARLLWWWGSEARGLRAGRRLHASHFELTRADADGITNAQHRWPVDPLIVDKRPVCRSEILHDQLPASGAIEARVSSRELWVAAQGRGALLRAA